MNLAGLTPGWSIGYLIAESEDACEYRVLAVVSLIVDHDKIEPVVMLPNGQTRRASEVGDTAFAVGPGEDAGKVALAHAAGRGRRTSRTAAA